MIGKMKYAMLALPLALAISACSSPETQEEEQAEAHPLGHSGDQGDDATPAEAQSKALELAQQLSSGDLDAPATAATLNELENLVNDNIGEFPDDIRTGLTEDIDSAQTALENQDMEGLQEAASSIESKLSGAAPAADAG